MNPKMITRVTKTEFETDDGIIHDIPSQKPVELCEYLIKTYSNEDDLVLDNCAGSG